MPQIRAPALIWLNSALPRYRPFCGQGQCGLQVMSSDFAGSRCAVDRKGKHFPELFAAVTIDGAKRPFRWERAQSS